MALSQLCLSTALPLLVVMAIAAAPSISGAAPDDLHELWDAAPGAKAGRGRFLAKFEESLPVSSRRHLNSFLPITPCDAQKIAFCEQFGRDKGWTKPACCPIALVPNCQDIGSKLNCGSCFALACLPTRDCCNGVCTDTKSDRRNCNKCGTVCPVGQSCTKGMCGY